MNKEQRNELLYQALETEMGGVEIYRTAVSCAVNADLKREWEEYLEQTTKHVQIVENVFDQLGLEKSKETPGRAVVRHIGESLVKAMEMAKANGNKKAAELVAAECVILAENKDYMNWDLIGELAKKETGEAKKVLSEAYEEVHEEESEHLYHTKGWCRELWIDSLGMPAVLPPPEEEKDVKTAIGAEKAKNARTGMI
jgi:ferritin-like metal-binding protein YciE